MVAKKMDRLKTIAVLDNAVEAHVLEAILNAQGVPHVMKSYHDSAYDGLFQAPRGWGHVEAPEKHEPEVLDILKDLRAQAEGNAESKGQALG